MDKVLNLYRAGISAVLLPGPFTGLPLEAAGGVTEPGYLVFGSGAPINLSAGLLYNVDLLSHLRLTVSTGPGYYNHESSTKSLGYPNEFYSNIEVSTKVWEGHRPAQPPRRLATPSQITCCSTNHDKKSPFPTILLYLRKVYSGLVKKKILRDASRRTQ